MTQPLIPENGMSLQPHPDSQVFHQTEQKLSLPEEVENVFWRENLADFPAGYPCTPIPGEHHMLVGAMVRLQDFTKGKPLNAKALEEARLAEVARVLGDIGHDIKNLLMPVLSGSSLLQEELDDHFGRLATQDVTRVGASESLSKEIVDMIRNNAQRIQDRVREIADAVKGVTAPLHIGPCDVHKIVADVIGTLRCYASQKGVALQIEALEDLPVIPGDERRLFNAFYNLINNAIPEVPSGGSVTVRGSVQSGGQSVLLAVADTGRGMPKEIQERLFTYHAISRKAGGSGLGTKIVKDVVDAHNGTIRVESEEGVGTTFYLSLPIARSNS